MIPFRAHLAAVLVTVCAVWALGWLGLVVMPS